MTDGTLGIIFCGEELVLHPEGVIWWPATHRLILSDVHLGKSATFRTHGIPVPEGETDEDLIRIEKLVSHFEAEELIIAGDLFHSRAHPSADLLETLTHWIRRIPCKVTLVRGNHDPSADKLSMIPGLETASDQKIRRVTIVHDPADAPPDHPAIAGHLHPLCRIGKKAGPKVRVPCFYQTNQTLILPAFGTFTSGTVINAKPSTDLYYAIVSNRVVPLATSK